MPNPFRNSKGQFSSKGAGGGKAIGRKRALSGSVTYLSQTGNVVRKNNKGLIPGQSRRQNNLRRQGINTAVASRGTGKPLRRSSGNVSRASDLVKGDSKARGARIGSNGKKISTVVSTTAGGGKSVFARGFKDRYAKPSAWERKGRTSQIRSANIEIATSRQGSSFSRTRMAGSTSKGKPLRTASTRSAIKPKMPSRSALFPAGAKNAKSNSARERSRALLVRSVRSTPKVLGTGSTQGRWGNIRLNRKK